MTHEIILDFEIQAAHLNPARQQDIVILKKEHAVQQNEIKENEQGDLAWELRKMWQIWKWRAWNGT